MYVYLVVLSCPFNWEGGVAEPLVLNDDGATAHPAQVLYLTLNSMYIVTRVLKADHKGCWAII